jgi:flavin reductase (DIM6/NTAB) family NADH-FMN oxidoreductase RutF
VIDLVAVDDDCETHMGVTYAAPDRGHVRRALGSFAAGVTVITTRDENDAPVGMTATAFTSVSFSPASVLVCLNLSARTHAQITRRGRFGVNLLGTDGQSLSDYCAVPGQDKLLPREWLEVDARWQSPCLNGAMAFFDCHVAETVETGTHIILVGMVQAVGLSPHREFTDPLIHFRGTYRRLSPIVPGATPDPLPIVFDDSLIMEAQ